ncbi:MAG: type II toxin-antitoxin system YafQ family toxin [Ignavibacteriaceae bacterium]|nr:type II toxin-antitoxin system YafQ family toxin [Ignavibacteriaceae bacterium]
MLTVKRTSIFKSDYKKAIKQNKDIEKLKEVIITLCKNEQLDPKYKDHPLSGKFRKYRDCHIEPDWVLIYEINEMELSLIRLGSHSELFD